jgi:hypothetical protein
MSSINNNIRVATEDDIQAYAKNIHKPQTNETREEEYMYYRIHNNGKIVRRSIPTTGGVYTRDTAFPSLTDELYGHVVRFTTAIAIETTSLTEAANLHGMMKSYKDGDSIMLPYAITRCSTSSSSETSKPKPVIAAQKKAKKMVKKVNAVKKANKNKNLVESIKTRPQWLKNGEIDTKVLLEYYSGDDGEFTGDVSLAGIIGYASLISFVPWHVDIKGDEETLATREFCYSTGYYTVFNDGDIWKDGKTLYPRDENAYIHRREEVKFQFIRSVDHCYSYILTRDLDKAIELRNRLSRYYLSIEEAEKKSGEPKPSADQVNQLACIKEYADSIRILHTDADKLGHYYIIGAKGDIDIMFKDHTRIEMVPRLPILIHHSEHKDSYTIPSDMQVHFNPSTDGFTHTVTTDDLLKATTLRSMIEAYTNKYYIHVNGDSGCEEEDNAFA